MSHGTAQWGPGSELLVDVDGIEIARCPGIEIDVVLTDMPYRLREDVPGAEGSGTRFLIQIGHTFRYIVLDNYSGKIRVVFSRSIISSS